MGSNKDAEKKIKKNCQASRKKGGWDEDKMDQTKMKKNKRKKGK